MTEEEHERLKQEFYDSQKKKTFFKNAQKSELAQYICSNMDENVLIERTFYNKEGTCIIFFDYTVFKTFANPQNYEKISKRFIEVTIYVINLYGRFECHSDLNTMTVSALQRHNSFINLYTEQTKNYQFSMYLEKFYIYNTPSFVDLILGTIYKIIGKDIRSRTITYTKKESTERMQDLNLKN